jgi:hypothetical protein
MEAMSKRLSQQLNEKEDDAGIMCAQRLIETRVVISGSLSLGSIAANHCDHSSG